MSDLTIKLVTWYFQNKGELDALKNDQYVLELEERTKDWMKVAHHVWVKPEVQRLYKNLKAAFPIQEDKPLFTENTERGMKNPLEAKGDKR